MVSLIEAQICDFLEQVENIVFQHGLGERAFFDIAGALPGGRAFFIKVKGPHDTITMHETLFIKNAIKIGAIAFIARDIMDVYKVFATGGIVNQ